VIADFRAALPGCRVYVYDNGSRDDTAEQAQHAGAIVRTEPVPGKGGVVRRMFAEIEADVFVVVDGDATYDAASAPSMVRMLVDQDLDMVTAVREAIDTRNAYRRGHVLGNRAFNALLGLLFGRRPADLFSGYRALSRRFVKTFPSQSSGFEIETEMTVHVLAQRLPAREVATPYYERPPDSHSKLSTWRDGLRILLMTTSLFRDERPLVFFGILSALAAIAGLALGVSVVVEYMETHLVPRLPTAILATGLMLSAFLGLACGLILDSVARGRREQKRLAYLAQPQARHAGAGVARSARAEGRADADVAELEADR
jgi:hypothetical protein